ncbi:MAG: UvrD-helicase domain-containing protein [Owenweeksia sp.]|nr:UvrD-helicase domain-containing protein [Owenweeksia sp.]
MARFHVYNASAGSGKTYSLVLRYLKICLADDNASSFMRILAITFTNKAAKEMKDRLINTLQELRDYQKQKQAPPMMEELCQSLKVTPEKLSYRAGDVLTSILHQYSAFSVSTIDKFTNRLIRSFARDLHLNTNYEVELDNESMLQEAIDQMMAGLKEDSLTTRFLLRFVQENLESGNSPRPESRLQEMGKNLFKEEAFAHLRPPARNITGPAAFSY